MKLFLQSARAVVEESAKPENLPYLFLAVLAVLSLGSRLWLLVQ